MAAGTDRLKLINYFDGGGAGMKSAFYDSIGVLFFPRFVLF